MKWPKYVLCLFLLMSGGGCAVYGTQGQPMPTSGFIATDSGLVYRYLTTVHKAVPERFHAILPDDIMFAQELRLKVRELGDQLFTTRSNQDLIGLIALPTSIVNLNDFTETTPFGRYLSEAMFYEFSQRGFPIREYRLRKAPQARGATAEFSLTRALPPLLKNQTWGAILVGTYLMDESGVFVNLRMVRVNGDVLRSAQVFLPMNGLLTRLLVVRPEPPLLMGSIAIQGVKK